MSVVKSPNSVDDRPLTETNAEDPSLHVEDGLWLEDGNVIIQAGRSLFRVHRGILAAHSAFFKKRFEQTCINGSTPAVSGVQGLTINQDASKFRVLLLGIYDPNFYGSPPSKVSLRDTLIMARMSSKYSVDFLFQWAMNHLSLSFPTSLAEWDDPSKSTIDLTRATVSDYMEAFRTSIEIKAKWLIPAVLYDCLTFSLVDIMNTDTWRLHHHSLPSLIQAHAKHRLMDRRTLAFFAHLPDAACYSKDHCREVSKRWYLERLEGSANNPLSKLFRKAWDKYLQSLCDLCLKRCLERHQGTREEIWEGLPKAYGSENDWNALTSLKGNLPNHLKNFAAC
ncbi:hypothetical protein GALMADRAFT_63111 [Galerina marginata CBS 339.88]|uniref:BTB domain-containing protein n=1 Tax=Galerina marginata (strain CBS 339.88) TaxID=685588 RepID=A0A067THX6_GALM3|nr:hypothetical protein GALMADRAFT_63111 [Galerina marginata CBS 339.88]